MGLFGCFMKRGNELTDEQKKWNKMWEEWAKGRADSPYAELMTYQSEVNNGGHDQYFFNAENIGRLRQEMAALETVLSEKLRRNLQEAYRAYLILEEKGTDEAAASTLERCDDVFFQNEKELHSTLKKYTDKSKL